MNVLLWALQILLAAWNLIGGFYVMFNYALIRSVWAQNFPRPVWVAYGGLEIICALGLLWPRTTPFAALGIVVLSLLGCVLSAKYAGFPGMLWGVIPALVAAFIAYGRFGVK